ncbi:hypothetical protein BGZ70_003816 [Mortierella alpina]|uniref:Auxin efflux carrier n=1 Tax=Mortierella alpina TaxID=64518 RepID=A0A9P6M4C5_MORAP|nr:hypothetical protein BGZ70_003816 [Mortierella alpina]
MDWLVLAGAAAEAVSQVLVVVACGVILSRTGYLSQSAQKSISQVNLYFMTPCLLFTKIASTINWEQFKAFWPIPLFFIFFSAVSWAVSRIGSRLLRFSSDEEKFVTASILFSNTNSLPMALIQSLALSAAGSRLLRDEQDTKEQVAARGISYILFYAIFGNLVRWSYGFSLLVPATSKKDDQQQHLESTGQEHMESTATGSWPEVSSPSEEVLIDVDRPTRSSDDTDDEQTDGEESQVQEPRPRLSLEHAPFFRAPQKSRKQLRQSTHMQPLSPPVVETSRSLPSAIPQHRRQQSQQLKRSTRGMLRKKASTVLSRVRQVLTPPLLTALLALVIGLVPQLHRLIMSPESKIYAFIIHPLETCGAAAIPMILLCLGAQVVHFATTPSATASAGKPASTTPSRPGQPVRRRSANTPSVFPHAHPVSDSSSSSEDEDGEQEDQGWLRVQGNPSRSPRRHAYGQEGIASTQSYASSTATLFHIGHDQDYASERSGLMSASNGPLMGHRFKRATPVAFALFARMVVVPLLCLPAILFHPDTLSPVLTMDPTFSLTLVLLVAAPTAINMIQLCQIKGFFEEEMAAVLFWSYCVLGVPCVLGWSLVGLWVAGR